MDEVNDLDNYANNRTHLLAKADSWACAEGKEDKGIWDEILLDSVVNESVRIEFVSL